MSDDDEKTEGGDRDDSQSDSTAMADDDWFERATGAGDADVTVRHTPLEGDSTSQGDASPGGGATGDEFGVETERGRDSPTALDADEAGTDASDTPGEGDDDDAGGLFDQDFASELGDTDAPPPDGGEGSGPPDFGMGTDEVDLTGDGEFEMGTGGDFGMGGGGFGMAGSEDFEEDDFESDIDRIDLGIEGLDEMIQGGVPRRSLMVAIGSAGTGKTTFGIQFLNEELADEDGGNAVFITLEESSDRIISSATEKGYPFDEYVEAGRLALVDMDPVEMANSLATIRSELPRLISEYNAERLVLDSVSLLEMMYDSRANRRNEIYDFTKSLKEAGVTTMLTSEAAASDPYSSRYGIVEYLTDAVFVLQYVRPSDFRKTRLAVEIQKIRDANHSRETKPYEITNTGISVYRQANIF